MKKIVFSTLVAAIATITLNAQEIPDRERKESKPISKEKIINKKERATLNLTDEQKAKLKSMNQDLRKQKEELSKQENVSVKEYREKMAKLRKEQQEKFQSILTPEQKTEMQKYKDLANKKTKVYGKKKEAKLKEELKLTDEQMAKMTENKKVTMERIRTIRDDKSLTEAQQKEEIKDALKKQKQGLKSVLTEEQLKKMKEGKRQEKRRKVI
jgi:hypothetical protein